MRAYGAVTGPEPLAGIVRDALGEPPHIGDSAIGLVGCGWIGGVQLEAYQRAGIRVVALCDRNRARAEQARADWAPDATLYYSIEELLQHPGLTVVDIATHVGGRPAAIATALRAGKHVLSQKPFVEHLQDGRKLADIAKDSGVLLAVNQNGRWAPHFGAMLALARSDLIGDIVSADFAVAWPHDTVVGDRAAFATMDDLILFDFGAHWFDVVGALAPRVPLMVFATSSTRSGQIIEAPTQADALVWGGSFRANLAFRAAERFAERGSYRVVGTRGVIHHTGLSLGGESVVVETEAGQATIEVATDWFEHGLVGTMRALLESIDARNPPSHDEASSLRGLAIAFAALESARSGVTVHVGAATSRGGSDG